ncbi:MAG: T9SS type A sorting domain-containing protein [Ignavibacteriales bacterium]|nr:T9SS type A sorting domain-containing protein [Ignavibacteriales bacterium]
MKHYVKLVLCFVIFSNLSFSQVIMQEDFNYPAGDTLNDHGWFAHSGVGLNTILVEDGSLEFSGYIGSGIGNKVKVIGGSGSREDVSKTFTTDSVQNIYVSLLFKVNAATATADYFFHLRDELPSSTMYRSRIFVQDDGSGLKFKVGLSKASSSIIEYYPTAISYGSTVLAILKYTYTQGASNDIVQLWINPALPGSEPPADVTASDVNSDIIIGAVALRQGAQAYNVLVDGLRVAYQWNDLPLPVELISFNCKPSGTNIFLSWVTATETNNSGFYIERMKSGNEYTPIAFIEGRGTLSESSSYSYLDIAPDNGTYFYRLKQIDFDGSYSYSQEVKAIVNNLNEFSLSQNFPNPFNPTTRIDYYIGMRSLVSLKIFDLLGNQVAYLIDEILEPGNYSVTFNASGFSSGVYFYRLENELQSITKKFTIMK